MDTHTKQLMFSSKESNWETPQDFFDKLDEHYNFDLDPCATPETAKCDVYYTEADDGLTQSWGPNRTVFVNPPYGRDIKKWIQKGYEESRKDKMIVAMLLPARTDTSYWHDYCMKASEIYFIRGRLKFGGATTGAPFPSAVVVFNSHYRGETPRMMAISR
jgi:site-specific DNA-methyltransferase (adenine-specific)|tara:strand:+ start:972 stop:1451 length:480 start_codon:yes stop_codon:yes gene_type:complete